MDRSKFWLTTAAVLGGLGVILGAFGAHGLDSFFVTKYDGQTREVTGQTISAAVKYLADYKSAVRYQMWHVPALFIVGWLSSVRNSRAVQVAGWCFLSGTVLFSGSLYVLTITGMRWLGMVAPIGGTLLIIGWFALAAAACPCRSDAASPGESNT
jgi:uncharacterized membrane protein YgdD (TMEM256/DUF423 family)